MAWPGSFPVCMASRCQGWPSSLSLVASSNGGAQFPIHIEQVVRSEHKRRPARHKRTPRSRAPPPPSAVQGVPKGSKNTPKAEVPLTPELPLRLTGMLGALWHCITGVISLTYLVLDGHFGNHHALQMAYRGICL